jgi:hypothetical protein
MLAMVWDVPFATSHAPRWSMAWNNAEMLWPKVAQAHAVLAVA